MPDLVDGAITLVAVLAMIGVASLFGWRDRRRHDRAVDARIRARYQTRG